jgi:hypothetical protein
MNVHKLYFHLSMRAQIDCGNIHISVIIIILAEAETAAGQALALLAVLAVLNDLVAVGGGAVFQVVDREADGLGLAGRIVLRQVIRIGEVQLRQAFRFRQQLPIAEPVVNRGMKESTKDSDDDDR